MSIVGQQLGVYRILSLLGAGAMGEVYRARDERLGRDVALKILPAEFSQNEDRLRRFQQEARAAGQLNHPNIIAVHDVGVHDRSPYLVSELLEGATLQQRIAGRPLPARRALEYGTQLAHGLAAAHAKGIIHRDLKPANVFITNDGHLKILDFGLAKLTGELPADEVMVTAERTQAGVVLGTPSYMAPEQASGLASDHRSDIFSLGAILYEILSGQSPFRGSNTAETISAILRDEPREFSDVLSIPPGLDRVVRHCLEKQPIARFQSAHDLAFALEALLPLTGSSPAAKTAPPMGSKKFLPALLIGLALVAATGAGWLLRSRVAREPPPQNTRVHRLTDSAGLEESPAISQIGRASCRERVCQYV